MADPFKTPLFNLHDLIVIATAIAALLMLVMQAVAPIKNRLASRYLTVFFSCLFINSISIELMWNTHLTPFVEGITPVVMVFTVLANLLKGPALFLYVSSIVQADFQPSRQQLLHLVPSIIVIAILFVIGGSPDHLAGAAPSSHQRLVHDLWLIMKGMPALYALASIPIALSASHVMQSYYSNDNALGKNWLSLLCIGYAAYWGWTFISHLFGNTLTKWWHYQTNIADILGILSNYMAFGLLLVLFSYSVSLTQQQLNRALSATKPKSPNKQPSPAPDSLATAIENAMTEEKLYLQSNLTAEQFADHLGHSPREISAVLNQHFEKNFFEFINYYRVQEAQRLLTSSEHEDTSITDILYMSGFNSKSAFQRFFKRITEMSPSEYRNRHKAQ